MAAHFELGFAPTGWDNLVKTAKDNKGKKWKTDPNTNVKTKQPKTTINCD